MSSLPKMNGLIIVNKEKDWTSRDVVSKVSHIFNTPKVGHTGTLDPIATGVLVLALGDALKIVDYLVCDTKEYIATVKCGIETDTLDVTGNILKEEDFVLDKEKLIEVLNSFICKYNQEVPKYSAIKVNGKRLYEYARGNIDVVLPKREVEIFSIELLDIGIDTFTFKTKVSKGTYIRSLVRDIGNKLGILCTMQNLERTKQGKFDIKDSCKVKDIENNNYKLITIYDALSDMFMVNVDNYLENRIKNGNILENRYDKESIVFVKDKKVLAIYKTYEKDKSKIKPFCVFK